jgi:hypothetical protein
MIGGNLRWIIDRRAALPAVGSQGMRPTCLSWAVTTAHNYSRPGDHSVEYLHHSSRQYPHGVGSISAISLAIAIDGQPPEHQWPYDPTADETNPPTPPHAAMGPFVKAQLKSCSPDPATVLAELRAGYLPVVGLLINLSFARAPHGIVLDDGPGVNGHAVTVVGAAEYEGAPFPNLDPGDLLLCLRNSWGQSWGINGQALIGPKAWRALARDAILLDAN